ncbi:hypothetical protein Golax_006025, partial [Gossypium laxum]|nr:hypothetical protein [Gossypium laxum]
EFKRIAKCIAAKSTWGILESAHEGTSSTKQSNMSDLQARELEKATEAIGEFYATLPDLSNQAFSLGEEYSSIKLVKKVLISLRERFSIKIIIIEETKGLESLLSTFEMKLEDVKCSKTKGEISIAFQLGEEMSTSQNVAIEKL